MDQESHSVCGADLLEEARQGPGEGGALEQGGHALGEEESEDLSTRLTSDIASVRDLLPVTRAEFQKLVDRVETVEARVGIESPSGAEDWSPG